MDQRFQNLLVIAQDKCAIDGLRLTQKRKQVLNILIEGSSPLSAYEIKDLYAEKYDENIKPMTIYRALEFLSQANLIHKLNLNNKYIGCARAKCCERHGYSQFLICVRCGAVEETNVDPIVYEHLVQQAQAFQCEIITPHLEVACVCARCQ